MGRLNQYSNILNISIFTILEYSLGGWNQYCNIVEYFQHYNIQNIGILASDVPANIANISNI